MRNKITDYLEERYPHDLDKILLADGFEEAFMGVVESFGSAPKACYNYDTCIDVLMRDIAEGDSTPTYDEAVEYLEFKQQQHYQNCPNKAFFKKKILAKPFKRRQNYEKLFS